MKAMIFAAGLGTRLKPLTDNKPKALVEINGITLLELTIRRLISFEITEIIINIHHFGDLIIDFLKEKNNFDINIVISDERKKLLNTGGGLKKAAWFFTDGKPFIVHNTDIITDLDLLTMNSFHRMDSLVTLAVSRRKTSRYFLFNSGSAGMELCGWKNEKTGEKILKPDFKGRYKKFAFSGIHLLNPKIFDYMPDKDVFSIVDVYLELMATQKILGYEHKNCFWMDVGKIDDLKKIERLRT